MSPQRPAAVILTASPKTHFTSNAWFGCNLSVEQILRSRNSINLFTINGFISREGQKLDTKLKNISYFCRRIYNAFGKLRGSTFATYGLASFETNLADFVLGAGCSYLTLFMLLGFAVLKSCR